MLANKTNDRQLEAQANSRSLKSKVFRSTCKTEQAQMKSVLFEKGSWELKRLNRITPEYAYELLLSEMDLEIRETASKTLVARLFELYKVGVEYYNFRQDSRQAYFKRKIDYLSNHPLVLDLLHRQNEREDNFYKKKHIERLVEINKKDTFIDVQQMLKKVDEAGKKNGQTVKKHLSIQLQDIHRRIQSRKKGSKPKDPRHQEVDTVEFDVINIEDCGSSKPSASTKVSFSNTQFNPDDDQQRHFLHSVLQTN